MMTKTAYYMQMAQEAAAQITGSKEQWTAFLTTSARLYKYPFAEQLMIYKQDVYKRQVQHRASLLLPVPELFQSTAGGRSLPPIRW